MGSWSGSGIVRLGLALVVMTSLTGVSFWVPQATILLLPLSDPEMLEPPPPPLDPVLFHTDGRETPSEGNQPPVTSSLVVGSSGMAGWYVSPVTVSLESADENSASVSIAYRISGGTWQNYTEPFTVAEDGVHLVEFFATDEMGALEAVKRREIKVDATPPKTTLLVDGLLGEGGWYTSAVKAWPAPLDVTSGVRALYFRLDGGPWTDLPPPLLLSSGGEHTLEFFAEDIAGNTEAPGASQIRIDRDPPQVVIFQPRSGESFRTSSVDLEWSALDEVSGVVSCRATLDGEHVSSDSSASVKVNGLGGGAHELRVVCSDSAGNQGEASVPFFVDLMASDLSASLGSTALLALILVPSVGGLILWMMRRRRNGSGDRPR